MSAVEGWVWCVCDRHAGRTVLLNVLAGGCPNCEGSASVVVSDSHWSVTNCVCFDVECELGH